MNVLKPKIKNIPFLKIFSIINLLFLTTVFFVAITPASFALTFGHVMFVVTILFLVTCPVLYAFDLYPHFNKNIITFFELAFGSVFVYQMFNSLFLPFVSILDILRQEKILLGILVPYKIFFVSLLIILPYVSAFYTFKYFYVLKQGKN